MASENIPSSSRIIDDASNIQFGHMVLVRLPNGEFRSIKMEKKSTVSLGRFGSFNSEALLGHPYGLSYEIRNGGLHVIPAQTIQELEDTDATNELINDGESVQPVTLDDIEAMKQAGAHASDIIQKQIELHSNYALKTEYSKDKYKKRKEAKFSKRFTTIEPTIFNVCEYWYDKDPYRIRDIRADTLSQMMNLSNVQPGGRYIVVDDASGMVVAAVLDRMGGSGKVITICDVDSPPAYPVVSHMNFNKDILAVMSSLNWATADEDYTPLVPPSEAPSGQFKSERQKSRMSKRKSTTDGLMGTRDELFSGEFQGLIIASEYDALSIVEKYSAYLTGSASIVVYSPYVTVVAELHTKLRALPQYLGPVVTEAWLRRYQVLPGRTHPMMNSTGTGGFLLHAIKVIDNPEAKSVLVPRRNKKRKVESRTEDGQEETSMQSDVSLT